LTLVRIILSGDILKNELFIPTVETVGYGWPPNKRRNDFFFHRVPQRVPAGDRAAHGRDATLSSPCSQQNYRETGREQNNITSFIYCQNKI